MGIVLIKLKVMPTSPEVDLNEIKERAKKVVEKSKGRRVSFEEQPIAFGLKALIVGFNLDESLELEPIERAVGEIENVQSVQVADMRRAFG
jgi:elongation factor 1-beta